MLSCSSVYGLQLRSTSKFSYIPKQSSTIDAGSTSNPGGNNEEWHWAFLKPLSPTLALRFPTSSGDDVDSDDPLEEINSAKNDFQHNSDLVRHWQQRCAANEERLVDVTVKANTTNYRKEKQSLRARSRMYKRTDLELSERRSGFQAKIDHMSSKECWEELDRGHDLGFEACREKAKAAYPQYNWDVVSVADVKKVLFSEEEMFQHPIVKAARGEDSGNHNPEP